MPRNEAQTRFELIDPAIHARGWTTQHVKVEETAGGIEVIDGKARRRPKGRMDYLLRLQITSDTQSVAVALIEAKAEGKSAGFGLEQGKRYADCAGYCESNCQRLNVKFIFSTNGHQYVEFDKFTGLTSRPRPMTAFPSPEELRSRYEKAMGFSLESEAAKPLLTRYSGGEAQRRYYQDAAIRAVFEKIAQGANRALLSLATGAGKTFIAVNLLKRIADAGQMKKALFLCDRDELRIQALAAFHGLFGSNAAAVENKDAQKNARIIIATYQSLGIANEDEEANFLIENYPPNFFSHVVIDECHRSAWGKWSLVLIRNSKAVQIGLTATPRSLVTNENTPEAKADEKITADNIRYFGEPVYQYDMLQAVEDGYLAACEIQRGNVNLDDAGISIEEIMKHNPVDWDTGIEVHETDLRDQYGKTDYEDVLLLPNRIAAMCADLFQYLLKSDSPEQKTIVFCVRDVHAELVANEMNNLYAAWCASASKEHRAKHFAFKCTATSGGSDYIADMKGSNTDYFIAVTVDLLSTGVDIPAVRNIVFFRYMKSPISFYQMVGRGTRLAEDKLSFTIYDYTDATRLFGEEFKSTFKKRSEKKQGDGVPPEPTRIIAVDGFEAVVTNAGRFVVTQQDGHIKRITVEEYKAGIAAHIVQDAATLNEFRVKWVDPAVRRELLDHLVTSGYSPEIVRQVEDMNEYDIYDILVNIAYGVEPQRRQARAFSFTYKQRLWLDSLPEESKSVILAIANQFVDEGTDAFENQFIFEARAVKKAGGIAALKNGGNPAELMRETKVRMFAA
jgi:type I restriction enzyme R subunit